MLNFAIPTAIERHSNSKPVLDEFRAARVSGFTAIKHQKLWLFVFVDCPTEATRDKLGKYFIEKHGNLFVYAFTNDHALEVWA